MRGIMTDMLEVGRQALASQPFSRFIGAQITHFGAGEAELVLDVRPEHLQGAGFVHGGVLSYLADNALTFAGGTALGPLVLTAEFKINYVRPAGPGRLRARAAILYAGKRQAVCRCDVFNAPPGAEEKLCAVAQGTIVTAGE